MENLWNFIVYNAFSPALVYVVFHTVPWALGYRQSQLERLATASPDKKTGSQGSGNESETSGPGHCGVKAPSTETAKATKDRCKRMNMRATLSTHIALSSPQGTTCHELTGNEHGAGGLCATHRGHPTSTWGGWGLETKTKEENLRTQFQSMRAGAATQACSLPHFLPLTSMLKPYRAINQKQLQN